MPIRIPDALPATSVLEGENIFVMTEHRAIHQDIRPLRVLILNLMPTKIETETQILRKLSNTPLQVEVDLLQTVSHRATHVPAEHLESFYVGLDDIRHKRYDGMIITGAPVELYDFETVLHVLYLLGSAGGHLLSLRHRQAHPRQQDVGHLRASDREAFEPARARYR